MQIWTYAATATGDFLAHSLFEAYYRFVPRCSISALIFRLSDRDPVYERVERHHNQEIFRAICGERQSLMQTCRIARLVALEMWRKDMKKLEDGTLGDYGLMRLSKESFEQIVKRLDKLLE